MNGGVFTKLELGVLGSHAQDRSGYINDLGATSLLPAAYSDGMQPGPDG
jgi:hypothetical protein